MIDNKIIRCQITWWTNYAKQYENIFLSWRHPLNFFNDVTMFGRRHCLLCIGIKIILKICNDIQNERGFFVFIFLYQHLKCHKYHRKMFSYRAAKFSLRQNHNQVFLAIITFNCEHIGHSSIIIVMSANRIVLRNSIKIVLTAVMNRNLDRD